MTAIEVKLEGTEELLRNLQKIDKNIRGDVAKSAVTAGATQIGNIAKINAPVKTGALRNSALVYPNGPVKVDTKTVTGKAVAEIGFHTVYARIQEFGGYAGRGHRVKIKGKHYLSNAINSGKSLAVKAMDEVIKHYLEK